jgi:hypothetical protein
VPELVRIIDEATRFAVTKRQNRGGAVVIDYEIYSDAELDSPEALPGEDAQQIHDRLLSRGRIRSPEIHGENLKARLRASRRSLVDEVMEKHNLSRDRALSVIESFGG